MVIERNASRIHRVDFRLAPSEPRFEIMALRLQRARERVEAHINIELLRLRLFDRVEKGPRLPDPPMRPRVGTVGELPLFDEFRDAPPRDTPEIAVDVEALHRLETAIGLKHCGS